MRLGMRTFGIKHNIIILAIIIAQLFLTIMVAKRLHNALIVSARAYANNIATEAVNKSIIKVFSGVDTKELSKAYEQRDNMLFKTDIENVNIIRARLTELLYNDITNAKYKTVKIPLGVITGIAVFSGAGPKIPVKIHPISIVNTDFHETFDDSGINQVRHRIDAVVKISVAYTGFMFTTREDISVTVPISDTVIVGDVPIYYGNGNLGIEVENGTDKETIGGVNKDS